MSDNLSLAQYNADPRAYEAAYNRNHRRDQRGTSETQQHHVQSHAWNAQEEFRRHSPVPGVVTAEALAAARRAR